LDLLLAGIRRRLGYLCEVGLGYLTLDRQTRTLSGGEVQRVNLTTALGTALVNTLFVLDEPSIGLHPRDMDRIVGLLHRLRDAGNTLLVVEHDPQVMLAADRILDLGPGPGERGGELVFQGTPAQLLAAPDSVTAAYLTGRRLVAEVREPRPLTEGGPSLRVLGARANNLAGIDVEVPLNRLVVVTGVSGSGKSTLVEEVLYRAIAKAKGRPTEAPGDHVSLEGHELIADALLLDQSPIGRTSRSNPASYVGALDPIRKRLAATPLARERGYTAGTFSFNSGNGRCPTCGGSGFEHLEMQFLSDVYLRCPDCNGRRYRSAVLEVTLGLGGVRGLSIADILDLTVTQAVAAFSRQPEVLRALEPLQAVGLGYLRLGQPVPTLSGGEAQRLKLAEHLVQASGRLKGPGPRGLLFILDEPTTGLHFSDIATLLAAFRRLLDQGHSLLVIEHNLDVIRHADWLIDLGPEGGTGGGQIVCTGTPPQIAAHPSSHTGKALRHQGLDLAPIAEAGADYQASPAVRGPASIDIRHAREHNLKDLSLTIPHQRLTVITGVSGSGKSTLAFDILFNEGQRRYLESLNAYARQFVQPAARADVDAIFGIPPTVAIEQRTSRGGHKSTVGTLTEIHHFLRLLYVKLGTQHCPDCDLPIRPQSRDAILDQILRGFAGQQVALMAPLVVARKGIYPELARWAQGKGHFVLRVDGEPVPTDPWPKLDRFREHSIDLPLGEIAVTEATAAALRALLDQALDLGKGLVRVVPTRRAEPGTGSAESWTGSVEPGSASVEDTGGAADRPGRHPPYAETSFSTKRACPGCGRAFEEPDPRMFSYNSKHGWCPTCVGTGIRLPVFDADDPQGRGSPGRRQEPRRANSGDDPQGRGSPGRRQGPDWEEAQWLDAAGSVAEPCPTCNGQRLRREALAVRFHDRSIAEVSALTVDQAAAALAALDLDDREAAVARDLLPEIGNRLAFLSRVGLGYLSLDRGAPTLSGGEAQRIRLAAQLGSNLQGVCYVLDEPTIGLHPRDNALLLDTLADLEASGNTVVVVEHDEETIRRAEHVIDLGPGAGIQGGTIVAQGTAAELAANPYSVTGRYLARPAARHGQPRRPVTTGKGAGHLVLKGARLHNLRDLDLRLPLARLVCITGVSGSGKSTLIREVLVPSLRALLGNEGPRRPRAGKGQLVGCTALAGWQGLTRVLEVDQTPIGKTPRSCPATYVGFWDQIRRLFAATPEARMLGWDARRFSFNTPGGRCEACEGQGLQRLEMSFLPEVKVTCEVCGGTRFNRETREVRFKGLDIGQVLSLSVDEAIPYLAAHRAVHQALTLLQAVGLGYLTLGQHSPTLSGGEAQRIKLVTELAKARTGADGVTDRPTLYVLDEPTVGLHMADVERLLQALQRLVDAGHSVVVIEHNLDLMAEADWLIDLGPEGGAAGGRIVAEGTPAEVAAAGDLPTAAALRRHLAGHP
jgi:excinuclease ABC subunit A